MTIGIEGKVVVITGASNGLGEATARHLVQHGAKLVLGARRIDRLQKLAHELALGDAVRALSEGLRQEVKPYTIRTTVISPGAVATELPNSVTDPETAARIRQYYDVAAIPADSFARAVAFAISQPDDVDINEILFRPTRQEL